MTDSLDNAAAAALWALMNAPKERMGALYRDGETFGHTPTVTTGQGTHVSGTLRVPPGSLAALFHNHPDVRPDNYNASTRQAGGAEDFSPDDKAQARRLGVPSYIQTPSYALRRYDPKTGRTEEVLAEIPVDQIRAKYLAQAIRGT